jgi:hypothetical protein
MLPQQGHHFAQKCRMPAFKFSKLPEQNEKRRNFLKPFQFPQLGCLHLRKLKIFLKIGFQLVERKDQVSQECVEILRNKFKKIFKKNYPYKTIKKLTKIFFLEVNSSQNCFPHVRMLRV